MSYSPSNFRRTDVKRAIQAAQAAGIKIRRVELEGGKVSIIPTATVSPIIIFVIVASSGGFPLQAQRALQRPTMAS